jgi:hypothetical protein
MDWVSVLLPDVVHFLMLVANRLSCWAETTMPVGPLFMWTEAQLADLSVGWAEIKNSI